MFKKLEGGLGWVILLFSIGAAWGALTFQLRDLNYGLVQMAGRVAKIEGYLEKATKGDFTTSPTSDDPPSVLPEGVGQAPGDHSSVVPKRRVREVPPIHLH